MANPSVSTPRPWTAPTATAPVTSSVRLPGSKSMTARALVLSALADAPSSVDRPLRARDTVLMCGALRALGVGVDTGDGADADLSRPTAGLASSLLAAADADLSRPTAGLASSLLAAADASWRITPGPLRGPASIDVGLAGTIMRFVPPVAGVTDGPVTFDGDPHARTRPMGPLVGALRALGVRIDASPTDGLPLTVHGTGVIDGGEIVIDASGSSQLVSGLLLCAPRFTKGLVLRHEGPPVPSAPHLRMTTHMLRAAGARVDESVPDLWTVEPGGLTGRRWEIEPDLSGAAPFFAAAMVTGGAVTLLGWPRSSWQPVERLRELLTALGAEVTQDDAGLTVCGTGALHGIEADLSEVGELTPVIAALCALADTPSRLSGVAHIRAHETDRIAALARELTAVGVGVAEQPDGLEISPGPLHGATFATYDDHRMAHAAAVIGLAVPGVQLSDVACTAKTLPEFPELWSAMVTGAN